MIRNTGAGNWGFILWHCNVAILDEKRRYCLASDKCGEQIIINRKKEREREKENLSGRF